jgi:hypothetical protein
MTTRTFILSAGAALLALASTWCRPAPDGAATAAAPTANIASVTQPVQRVSAEDAGTPAGGPRDGVDVTGGGVVTLRDGLFRVDPRYAEQLLNECSTTRPLIQTLPVKTDDGVSGLRLSGGNGDEARHARARDVLAALGLRAGDVVVAIDGAPVDGTGRSAADPRRAWETGGRAVLRIVREGTTIERTYVFTRP